MDDTKKLAVEFGRFIKKQRQEAGYSQAEFAVELDFGASYVSKLEGGGLNLPLPTEFYEKLERILNVSQAKLIALSTPAPSGLDATIYNPTKSSAYNSPLTEYESTIRLMRIAAGVRDGFGHTSAQLQDQLISQKKGKAALSADIAKIRRGPVASSTYAAPSAAELTYALEQIGASFQRIGDWFLETHEPSDISYREAAVQSYETAKNALELSSSGDRFERAYATVKVGMGLRHLGAGLSRTGPGGYAFKDEPPEITKRKLAQWRAAFVHLIDACLRLWKEEPINSRQYMIRALSMAELGSALNGCRSVILRNSKFSHLLPDIPRWVSDLASAKNVTGEYKGSDDIVLPIKNSDQADLLNEYSHAGFILFYLASEACKDAEKSLAPLNYSSNDKSQTFNDRCEQIQIKMETAQRLRDLYRQSLCRGINFEVPKESKDFIDPIDPLTTLQDSEQRYLDAVKDARICLKESKNLISSDVQILDMKLRRQLSVSHRELSFFLRCTPFEAEKGEIPSEERLADSLWNLLIAREFDLRIGTSSAAKWDDLYGHAQRQLGEQRLDLIETMLRNKLDSIDLEELDYELLPEQGEHKA